MEQDWGRLGRAVKEARQAAGLSQVELAEAAGLSRSGVQSIERGRPFDAPQLSHRSVAHALGWTADSVSAVLAGRWPETASQPASPSSATQTVNTEAAGVDDLLDDLTERVRAALLGGKVADATAIDFGGEEDPDAGVVIIWKRGEQGDLTPEQQRDLRKRWARLQRAAHDILSEDDTR